ncbi:MAG TPA: thermonuclease family protein [Chromatiales bacterium]|nr:thermonuclease family protein [Chromatiales bacterium]
MSRRFPPKPHGRCSPLARGVLALCAVWWASYALALSGNAFVNEDGTLRLKGRTVTLAYIYIPPTPRTCDTHRRPPLCGSRARLALEWAIQGHFVHCDPLETGVDGSMRAVCSAGDRDLGLYLVERGWALALPDAPFAYRAAERIAERRGRGVWGTPVGEPGGPPSAHPGQR